jgi:hypothetical protein
VPEVADDLRATASRSTTRSKARSTHEGADDPGASRGAVVARACRVDGTIGPSRIGGRAALAAALAVAYGPTRSGARPTGTTHVSVLDADGAAVGLSSTLGSGSGVFRHGSSSTTCWGSSTIGNEPREAGARLPSR